MSITSETYTVDHGFNFSTSAMTANIIRYNMPYIEFNSNSNK